MISDNDSSSSKAPRSKSPQKAKSVPKASEVKPKKKKGQDVPEEQRAQVPPDAEPHRLIQSLQLLDPLIQFLTKATGLTLVPLRSLRSVIPDTTSDKRQSVLKDVPELYRRGVLHIEIDGGPIEKNVGGKVNDEILSLFHRRFGCDIEETNDVTAAASTATSATSTEGNEDSRIVIGFPPPPSHFTNNDSEKNTAANGKPKKIVSLHGSTKTAAKRRLSTLKRSLKEEERQNKSKKKEHLPNDDDEHENIQEQQQDQRTNDGVESPHEFAIGSTASNRGLCPEMMDGMVHKEKYKSYSVKDQYDQMKNENQENMSNGAEVKPRKSEEAQRALNELGKLFDSCNTYEKQKEMKNITISQTQNKDPDSKSTTFLIPDQAAFSGSHPARTLQNGFLSDKVRDRIPSILSQVMKLKLFNDVEEQCMEYESHTCSRDEAHFQLYSHQAEAIESALSGIHTLVCTGTGSGKSLCYTLPILSETLMSDVGDIREIEAWNSFEDSSCNTIECCSSTSLLIFPTKALAQDQLSKLITLVQSHPLLQKHIRPGVIDGDTPQPDRASCVENCNIILTNPDTIHAAILPGWKGIYKKLLSKLKYIVLDELHTYEGAFGAHISLVLSRLVRLCNITKLTSSHRDPPVFIGCSATIAHPEEHFRLLAPIATSDPVKVLTAAEDGSPCAAKHFFVWNPPLLDLDGALTDKVSVQKAKALRNSGKFKTSTRMKRKRNSYRIPKSPAARKDQPSRTDGEQEQYEIVHRSHAADETARVLSHAVKREIRCIAFCKTRMLAEWVYEKCISILKADASDSSDLSNKVEIYRGGYSKADRRMVESRLFRQELLGVVATSALELGVDIGGIDLTLHCGYPGSISSLLQQAGRAGRGGRKDSPSFSIMVCFSSPSEQHMWKNANVLLSRGLAAPPSVPLNPGIVQGHLLCAGEEFPLTGKYSANNLAVYRQNVEENRNNSCNFTDYELFGSKSVFCEAIENLLDRGQVLKDETSDMIIFRTHPSVKRPWSLVSLRSIEPVNYSIVDMSHPIQAGRNNGIHDQAAIMDTIPYSRVFYHAYPGAIIMHRGRRYKIHSINLPPPLTSISSGHQCGSSSLGAFAKPTTARYSTRALSINHITIVKQLHRVEILQTLNTSDDKTSSLKNIQDSNKSPGDFSPSLTFGCIAGNGVVNVKKTVHGYKKLSLVNRAELSRTEISVPPMEYDTNALWIDTEASVLNEVMIDYDQGVHALSHAILAVAPLFIPCTSSDIDCDHSRYGCTRVLLFDVRAGGSASTTALWKHFFRPNGVLDAAIDLLSDCPSCCETRNYKGGCPGCIQAVPCINFQQDLSRTAALIIARRMLARVKQSSLYKQNCCSEEETNLPQHDGKKISNSPTTAKREKALQKAGNLVSARNRSVVVGRPTWPTDEATKIGTDANDLS